MFDRIGKRVFVIAAVLWGASSAFAETPVQVSWRCDVAGKLVLSNTPCKAGAQPMQFGSSVIYRCEQNGVVSFQQSACKEPDAPVYLHNDVRTGASIASANQVRSQTVARANKARQEQRSREQSGKISVIGSHKPSGYTKGDGQADGYRNARGETASHSGY